MAEEKTKYIETVGRRKTAVARVRITPAAKNSCLVNEQDVDAYFKTDELRRTAVEALHLEKLPVNFKITAKIQGGGATGQAEALRHGIARALIIYDLELRKKQKAAGFL
ncbi:MAG: 30S ribosomal protein S9, partial [Candidatus Taylorbacteria bacterium]|nr:30S ribosomal protein S9 [Candidatus Taylorbacteria bacterium]